MDAGTPPDAVDLEIMDCLAGLFGFVAVQGEQIARRLGVPAFFLKALHQLDHPMAMKDLGRRMHCDPSFVTGIADMLEQRGLAVRESDPADRRVKRIVLTPAGEELKRQVGAEVAARVPWRQIMDTGARACLLGHIQTMVQALREASGGPGGGSSSGRDRGAGVAGRTGACPGEAGRPGGGRPGPAAW